VDIGGRFETMASSAVPGLATTLGQERARVLDQPYLPVALERYNRTASAVAVEPRHPFLDLRVVSICCSLPGEQKLKDGWPKAILRRAMKGRLPDGVRWRLGKQDLGWPFTEAFMGSVKPGLRLAIESSTDILSRCVDVQKLLEMSRAFFEKGDPVHADTVYEAALLAIWMQRQVQ
jgi:asparagine synthase (glutamine-hydrolysing)